MKPCLRGYKHKREKKNILLLTFFPYLRKISATSSSFFGHENLSYYTIYKQQEKWLQFDLFLRYSIILIKDIFLSWKPKVYQNFEKTVLNSTQRRVSLSNNMNKGESTLYWKTWLVYYDTTIKLSHQQKGFPRNCLIIDLIGWNFSLKSITSLLWLLTY